jgi:lactate/malate dehydrogenase, NAD binding domain
MSRVAVLGAGPIGGAITHRLAERARVGEVVLIDEAAQVAAGKALDIRQSSPISRSDAIVSATADALAAVGADVVVIADDTAAGEWQGERGLALVQRLMRAGARGAFVFSGPAQHALMETAVRELNMPIDRVVGSAASATASIARALAHIETGHTGANVAVAGRPPKVVIAWSSATIGGSLISERVPAHRLLAMSQTLTRLWPPGPQTIAAATTQIIEALILGSRESLPALAMLDGEFEARGVAGMLQLDFGHGRIQGRSLPSLSPQERTEAGSAIHRR